MNGIIVYKSKYGSTQQFAEWVQEDTDFEIYNISNYPKNLTCYETIIVGSSIHAGSLSLKNFLIHNWPLIRNKRVVIMLTSGTSNKEFLNKVLERSLPTDIINAITLFPVGGRYLFNRMSFLDRALIKVAAFFAKHQETKKGMLTERDEIERNNLDELLGFIKSEQ